VSALCGGSTDAGDAGRVTFKNDFRVSIRQSSVVLVSTVDKGEGELAIPRQRRLLASKTESGRRRAKSTMDAHQQQRRRHVESDSIDILLTESNRHAILTGTLDDSTVVDWHSHAFAQMLCPSKGVVSVIFPNSLCVVPENYGLWIPAGYSYAVVASTTSALGVLCIRLPPELIEGHPHEPAIRRLNAGAERAPPDQIYGAFSQSDDAHASENQLLQYLSNVPVPSDRRARPIAFGLVTALHDLRTLKEWGALSGASERTLTRIFQTEVGMSFRAWRTRVQVAQTIALLLSGQSVKSAACSAGYSSPSAFVAAFRLATGESPMRYLRSLCWD
jgi:AraC-like DNA-binding protein/mannose-6-phosphate isomerase-like protein (cupin superfamily)